MPNVTVSSEAGEKVELKTAPGAFVRLRPLPFGKKLERRDKATRMSMEQETAQGRFYIEALNRWSRQFDFEYCIVEHNLEDANGTVLDFSNPMTLDILLPKVGSEIEALIDELNEEEDDETLEDFTSRHTTSLAPEEIQDSTHEVDTN